jgi:hypothetical protein
MFVFRSSAGLSIIHSIVLVFIVWVL